MEKEPYVHSYEAKVAFLYTILYKVWKNHKVINPFLDSKKRLEKKGIFIEDHEQADIQLEAISWLYEFNIKKEHTSKVCKHGYYTYYSECDRCKREKYILKKTIEMQDIAKNNKGYFLDDSFIKMDFKHNWRCCLGHEFKLRPGHALRGTWCPICYKESRSKFTIDDCKKLAVSRNGLCLEDKYINERTSMKWYCNICQKTFIMKFRSVIRNRWCYHSKKSKGERYCQLVFETLLNESFPSCWPDWLINSNNNKMELDGFCSKLSLAFEHNGGHHINKDHYLYKVNTNNSFEKRILMDAEKVNICKDHGIVLINIPEVGKEIKLKDLKDYIINEIRSAGLENFLIQGYTSVVIDYSLIY